MTHPASFAPAQPQALPMPTSAPASAATGRVEASASILAPMSDPGIEVGATQHGIPRISSDDIVSGAMQHMTRISAERLFPQRQRAMTSEASILAVDPGTLESGWVILSGRRVLYSGVSSNLDTLARVAAWPHALAVEMIASYGMPVGREVFETCVWIGRFVQAYRNSALAQMVYRKDVKMHLCGTPRAKDPHIRQALIDMIGPQGVKKAPGPTYGVKSHAWAALGVAVTAMKLQREPIAPELPL